MTPDWQAIGAFISAAIWELLWIGVSILIVYGIAVWKGDELLARAAERRRLHEWSRVSLIVAFRIQLAVMRGAWVPAYQAALPVAPPEVASRGAFEQWAAQIRALLGRKGDASVLQKRHFRSEDDIRLLVGASTLVPPMKYAYRELYSLLMAFRTALPSRVEQALCVAVVRLQEFTESVKRLDADTVDKMDEREFDVQLTQNAQLTASAFEALSELMKIVHEAKQRLGTR